MSRMINGEGLHLRRFTTGVIRKTNLLCSLATLRCDFGGGLGWGGVVSYKVVYMGVVMNRGVRAKVCSLL